MVNESAATVCAGGNEGRKGGRQIRKETAREFDIGAARHWVTINWQVADMLHGDGAVGVLDIVEEQRDTHDGDAGSERGGSLGGGGVRRLAR